MNSAHETPQWLNYHHLRHFWMIARHRSVTRAAAALNISQSTLSEQLSELEDWLGQPLFESAQYAGYCDRRVAFRIGDREETVRSASAIRGDAKSNFPAL